MASATAGAKGEKLSFAKIAASAIKPPNLPQTSSKPVGSPNPKAPTSAPREVTQRTNALIAPVQVVPRAERHEDLHMAAQGPKESASDQTRHPEVRIHTPDNQVEPSAHSSASAGSLKPSDTGGAALDGTSSDIAKPPSPDGKSVASGTTFALDEKESLRPDDSASIKAGEDDDLFSPPESVQTGVGMDSEEGVRAFRDQLREISSMEPGHHDRTTQVFGAIPGAPAAQRVLYVPSAPGIGVLPNGSTISAQPAPAADVAPDPKLLEALDSPRDRIWVLKLEQDIFDFVKDPTEVSLNLPQCNAYHRMLAHKIADYYMLGHAVDDSASAVRLYKTPNCRIPPPLTGITTPSTAASTPPPNAQPMKILRRGLDGASNIAHGSNLTSKTTSENGESGNDDDKPKPPPSREEKEARYEAARLRIMGSAKPSEQSEEAKAQDESRSSSVAGKKKTRKQQSDSDEGFEARSAYSAYYTAPYKVDTVAGTYGYQGYTDPSNGALASPLQAPDGYGGMQHFQHSPLGMQWNGQSYQPVHPGQQWTQPPSASYDLANEFQRSMSLQNVPMSSPGPSPSFPPSYEQGYQQRPYEHQSQWQQVEFNHPMQQSQAGYGTPPSYFGRSTSSQGQDAQSYPFGQLPSQTFPGRPPSNLEHPLPGSYKSKHFNPQSQAFVPGQPNGPSVRPQMSGMASPAPGYGSPYGVASPLQRQMSSQSQSSSYGSPRHPNAPNNAMPMVHPLPQPVFPQQPMPSMPLPPKPGPMPQHPIGGPSSIAKWGAGALLPAKPPPPVEAFEQNRFQQVQRQPSYPAPGATRNAGVAMPSFGSMPPIVGGRSTAGRRV